MHISSAQGLILFYDDCLFTYAVYKHIFKRTARLSDGGGMGARAQGFSGMWARAHGFSEIEKRVFGFRKMKIASMALFSLQSTTHVTGPC